MKLTSVFRKIYSKRIEFQVPSKARIEIDAYFNCNFHSHYKELKAAGELEQFLDDSEILYHEMLQLVKDGNPRIKADVDEEKIAANDEKQALLVVFQDIKNKLHIGNPENKNPSYISF